jgi:uncharacterized protein
MEVLTGRETEKMLLQKALYSTEASLIAVYGRRRVGKTFLIRSFFKEKLVFEFSGIHEASLQEQLQNLSLTLQKAAADRLPIAVPKNWIAAFDLLQQHLSMSPGSAKKVVFFDEFPWIHTPKSGFLQAFEHFWNGWASQQPNLVVVICGSAASWMIENIVNNKGGLHNRITQTIRLLPFSLGETEQYLKSRGVVLDHYQLLQIYMAMGGVPQYLKGIEPGESAAQNIDRLFFAKDGALKTEFNNLYQSLFEQAQHHITVIRALAKKSSGLTRNEIIAACKLSSGGTTTRLLEELEESGFIRPYIPFDKTTKDGIYKLTDEYSLFYLKFADKSKASGKGTWLRMAATPSYASWAGFAFEAVCQKHTLQLKRALGIEGVYTETSVWRYHPASHEPGAQIDLLIDRQDMCINICEMKFTVSPFEIDKRYANALNTKLSVFRRQTNTKKTLFLTMVSTHGVKRNSWFTGLVQNEINMDALFTI